jgi:hypothetical protein
MEWIDVFDTVTLQSVFFLGGGMLMLHCKITTELFSVVPSARPKRNEKAEQLFRVSPTFIKVDNICCFLHFLATRETTTI